MHRTLAVAITLTAVASRLLAQSGGASTDTPSPRSCWRGQPAPVCRTFWITEFGIDANMASTQTAAHGYAVRDFDSRFIWTVGPMFNDSQRRAVGGTVSISPLGGRYRAAIEARRRWWHSDDLAFDLSAGALQMSGPTTIGAPYRAQYGVTAGAFMVGGDLISVNGRVDLLVTGGRARAGASIGLAGGSYIALAGTLVLGALVWIIVSSGPWD